MNNKKEIKPKKLINNCHNVFSVYSMTDEMGSKDCPIGNGNCSACELYDDETQQCAF